MTLLKARVDAYALAEAAIRGAIVATRARKIRVRPGTPGILWGELSNTWVEDPGEQGVNPIGALLLGRTTDEESVWPAAAHALGVSLGWVYGCSDAWDCGEDDVGGLCSSYRAGFRFGQELRREFLKG